MAPASASPYGPLDIERHLMKDNRALTLYTGREHEDAPTRAQGQMSDQCFDALRGEQIEGLNRPRGEQVEDFNESSGEQIEGLNRPRGEQIEGLNRPRGEQVERFNESSGEQVERFNELRGEQVVYASHRQSRTFLPPEEHCPLCPTRPDLQALGAGETEIPFPAFEIAVFDNRFPAFQAPRGTAEVVVYTDSHHGSFGTLAHERAEALMWVWRHRYLELGARADVRYALIFENRGVEVGVTLHHPHGQIYGYPFLPPVPRLELAADDRLGGCAPCALLCRELNDGCRMVYENEGVVAYIPYAARWPYEAHAVIRRHRPSLLDCEAEELRLLAACLQAIARGYDALFRRPFPYVMVVHQAPTDGRSQGHLHVEFYPPLRTADKLKYLAGSEQGAGTFIGDTLPEESARALREAIARAA